MNLRYVPYSIGPGTDQCDDESISKEFNSTPEKSGNERFIRIRMYKIERFSIRMSITRKKYLI